MRAASKRKTAMSWFSALFSTKSHERRLDSELRYHLEQAVRDNIAAGMDPEKARRGGSHRFWRLGADKGGMPRRCEDSFGSGQFLRDVRYAVRSLSLIARVYRHHRDNPGSRNRCLHDRHHFLIAGDGLFFRCHTQGPTSCTSIGFKDRQEEYVLLSNCCSFPGISGSRQTSLRNLRRQNRWRLRWP